MSKQPSSITSSVIRVFLISFGLLGLPAFAGTEYNVAIGKRATQSSNYHPSKGLPSKAVDGDTRGNWSNGSVTHTAGKGSANPWWTVDLGKPFKISSIRVWNRTDCCSERLNNYIIRYKKNPKDRWSLFVPGKQKYRKGQANPQNFTGDAVARYVMVQLPSPKAILSLAEVEVFGRPLDATSSPISANQPMQTLPAGRTSNGNDFDRFAAGVMRENKKAVDALVSIGTQLMQGSTAQYFSSGQFTNDVKNRRTNQIERKLGLRALRTRLGSIKSPLLPKSFTIGLVADLGVGIAGNVEHGVAVNLTGNGPLLDIYRTFGVSAGLITGGSGSVVVSLWKKNPRQFVGEAKGLSFSAGAQANPATGISPVGGLGFWFSTFNEFPGGLAVDFREFQGLSIAVGAGASVLPVDLRGTSALTQVFRPNKGKFEADACGTKGIRPCHVVERFPSCNPGLDENFVKHRCVQAKAGSAVQVVHDTVKQTGKTIEKTIKKATSMKKIWVGNGKLPKAYRRACRKAGMKFSHDAFGYSYCK